MILAWLTSVALALNLASECGIVNDRCGFDDEGKPVRESHIDPHPSLVFHPDDHAHECCDGLMCENGQCHRPWGTAPPTAEDLLALYNDLSPEKGLTLETARTMLNSWQGREERLLTSVRLKHGGKAKKDEL
jgi:hypothetical protein